jgi:hypothetical protein
VSDWEEAQRRQEERDQQITAIGDMAMELATMHRTLVTEFKRGMDAERAHRDAMQLSENFLHLMFAKRTGHYVFP